MMENENILALGKEIHAGGTMTCLFLYQTLKYLMV